jgi:hypothetical protein
MPKAKRKKVTSLPTVRVVDLQRLIFCNSSKLPQVVDDEGRRKRWVGMGWVDEGLANGTEEARVER